MAPMPDPVHIPEDDFGVVFAVDDQDLAASITELIKESSISGYIDVLVRDRWSMRAPGKVTEFRIKPAVFETSASWAHWSSGEKLLWTFLLSLAGHAEINLGDFTTYFRSSPLRWRIDNVLALANRDPMLRKRTE